MDPHTGEIYQSIEDAKKEGVKEPLEVQNLTPESFILSANGWRYYNTRRERKRARKAQREARRRARR